MACYEYECNQCNNVWEEQRSVANRDNDTVCPDCANTCNKRIISASTFHLKGEGWADTGYSSSHLGNKWGMKPHKKGT